jgi:NADPH-dependent 2,4-dienoyl-CoA reductase/sulfur reductase-like enzyme
MAERLVAIGGDAASMTAASQAKRMRPDLEVVVLERGTRTSFAACGIPFFIGGEVPSLDALVARTPEEHAARGLDVRLRHEVTEIDLAAGQVRARRLDVGDEVVVGFDELMIGTGARPLRPPIPGLEDHSFVFGVQNLDDAEVLMRHAGPLDKPRVVVVGGGYVGLEMAEAFCHRGAAVTVVEVAPQVMSTLDPDMAELVVASMRRDGIEVLTETRVEALERGRVHTSAGELPADLVVLGLGLTPNTELAREAGIELGVRNAIRVDRRQRTSAPGVWAAGDCCESLHRVSGQPVHVALGTVANRQSRVAGINIGGGYATFPGVLGTAVTKICATEVGRTGLNGPYATERGRSRVLVTG